MSTTYTNLQIHPDEAQAMDVVRRINVAALIKEVDRHPLLYNNTPKQSCSTETKRKIWENIAEYLCGIQNWQVYSESEKDAVVREIQLKWKNLKDNYHRILRKEKEEEALGIPAFKRKKYIYYDALEFLKPYAPSTRSSSDMKEEMEIEGGKNAPHIIYINETNDSEEDSLLQSTSPTIPKQIKVQTPSMTPIAPLPQIPSFGTLQPVQFIHLQPNATVPNTKKDEGEEAATSKLTKILEQMVKTQEDDKNDDPMGNKKFLMSLVPFLKKLPDDVNLEVRLQIMGVIQSYGAKELF